MPKHYQHRILLMLYFVEYEESAYTEIGVLFLFLLLFQIIIDNYLKYISGFLIGLTAVR